MTAACRVLGCVFVLLVIVALIPFACAHAVLTGANMKYLGQAMRIGWNEAGDILRRGRR